METDNVHTCTTAPQPPPAAANTNHTTLTATNNTKNFSSPPPPKSAKVEDRPSTEKTPSLTATSAAITTTTTTTTTTATTLPSTSIKIDTTPISSTQQNSSFVSAPHHHQVPPLPLPPPLPPSTTTSTTTARRRCKCKNSKCLKLYCECFNSGEYCINCDCVDCHNNSLHKQEVETAVAFVKSKKPDAFTSKATASQQPRKGCRCRRSNCKKKYCDCYNMGFLCGEFCQCVDCKNCEAYQSKPLTRGSTCAEIFSNRPTAITTTTTTAAALPSSSSCSEGGAGSGLKANAGVLVPLSSLIPSMFSPGQAVPSTEKKRGRPQAQPTTLSSIIRDNTAATPLETRKLTNTSEALTPIIGNNVNGSFNCGGLSSGGSNSVTRLTTTPISQMSVLKSPCGHQGDHSLLSSTPSSSSSSAAAAAVAVAAENETTADEILNDEALFKLSCKLLTVLSSNDVLISASNNVTNPRHADGTSFFFK